MRQCGATLRTVPSSGGCIMSGTSVTAISVVPVAERSS